MSTATRRAAVPPLCLKLHQLRRRQKHLRPSRPRPKQTRAYGQRTTSATTFPRAGAYCCRTSPLPALCAPSLTSLLHALRPLVCTRRSLPALPALPSCAELGLGAGCGDCPVGTDCSDCGTCAATASTVFDDSCAGWANDGECDEPSYCAFGTDCTDCNMIYHRCGATTAPPTMMP